MKDIEIMGCETSIDDYSSGRSSCILPPEILKLERATLSIREFINEFDPDNTEGKLDAKNFRRIMKSHQFYKHLAYITIGLFIITLASIFGLTFLAIDLNKNTNTEKSSLVVSGTHDIIRTASAYTHEVPLNYASFMETEDVERVTTISVKTSYETFDGIATFQVQSVYHYDETNIEFRGSGGERLDIHEGEMTFRESPTSEASPACGSCTFVSITTDTKNLVEKLEEKAAQHGFRRNLKNEKDCKLNTKFTSEDLPQCSVCNQKTMECNDGNTFSGFNLPGTAEGALCGECDTKDVDCFCSCEHIFDKKVYGHWEYGKWQECSAQCEGGEQYRTIVCVGVNNDCDAAELESQTQSCNTQRCDFHEICESLTTSIDCLTEQEALGFSCYWNGKQCSYECPDNLCRTYDCQYGVKYDEHGCETCECDEGLDRCANFQCEQGYKYTANFDRIRCLAAPCLNDECCKDDLCTPADENCSGHGFPLGRKGSCYCDCDDGYKGTYCDSPE